MKPEQLPGSFGFMKSVAWVKAEIMESSSHLHGLKI